jgi:HK97 gp10 family phage protein
MVDVSVTMSGLDELNKKLAGLKYDIAKKGGRFALRKAAQVIRNQARQNAQALNDPETAATISKNITERWGSKFNQSTGDLMFRVGIMGGVFGKLQGDTTGVYGDKFTKSTRKKGALGGDLPGGDTRHWGYLEFGTETAAATPFLRPAMDTAAQKATDVFIVQYGNALDRALKKGAG